MRGMILFLVLSFAFSGCVSFGVECRRESINGWAKVRRVGFGISKRQAEALSEFKTKVCERP